LRVRLWFEPGTEQLHSLRWETLCGPPQDVSVADSAPLSTQDLVLFSRFLGSWGNHRVRLRPLVDLLGEDFKRHLGSLRRRRQAAELGGTSLMPETVCLPPASFKM